MTACATCSKKEFSGGENLNLTACSTCSNVSLQGRAALENVTGGASDIVKVESSGEDPRATGGLVSNLPHPRVNKTKQHTPQV